MGAPFAAANIADLFDGEYPSSGFNEENRSEGERIGKGCDVSLMPESPYGGGWIQNGKEWQMHCNIGGEGSAKLKCSKGNWFGTGSTDTCEVETDSGCDVDGLGTVAFGQWHCEGDQCHLQCDNGQTPLNSEGNAVTTTCENGTWWTNE